MRFSSFPNKPPEGASSEKPSSATMVVRTMQDDLASVRGNGQKTSQEKKQMAPQEPASPLPRPGLMPSPRNPFNEKRAVTSPQPQVQRKEMTGQQEHPFGVVPERVNRVAGGIPRFPTENGLPPLIQSGGILSNRPVKSNHYLLMGGLGAVAALLVLAAAWYFILGNGKKTFNRDLSVGITEETPEVPADLTPQTAPYSRDTPNYLSFDTETVSPLDIRRTLSQAADSIRGAGIAEPIEFLVTDQNNNPLAFSRFAFLLQLDLDPTLLALVNESFSLYEYNDAGAVRLGLALTLSNAKTAGSIIQKTETALPYAFRQLILEPDIPVAKKSSFRSTQYNQFPVRFFNTNSSQNISLDYVLDNNQLFIGTSKNTLRAILDANAKR